MRDYQLNYLVDILKKQLRLDKVNVAVVTDVALWTEIMHGGFQEAVRAHRDCNLVYNGKIARDAVDFTAELTELRSKNAQLILVAMGYAAGYTYVKQAYDVKLPAIMAGMNVLSWSVSDFIKAVGKDAAAYNANLCYNTLPPTPNTTRLIKEYERVYGGAPHMDVGATYNGVKAYAKAVEMAKSLDHEKVRMALGKVRLPESQSWNCKEFWFDDNRRVHISPANGLIFYTYQFNAAGGVNIVAPPEYKTGDVLIPPWMPQAWKK